MILEFAILLTLAQTPQPPTSVYCVTTLVNEGRATVVCDAPAPLPTCSRKNDPTCTKLTLDLLVSEWPEAWEKPQVRQLLKGELIDHEKVRPLVNCTPINQGDRLALNAGPRKGCEREPSTFIQVLMRNWSVVK